MEAGGASDGSSSGADSKHVVEGAPTKAHVTDMDDKSIENLEAMVELREKRYLRCTDPEGKRQRLQELEVADNLLEIISSPQRKKLS